MLADVELTAALIEGLGLPTPDERNLIKTALVTRAKGGHDLEGRVLAQARTDLAGQPWQAFVYAFDSLGSDLRYVGHREALRCGRPPLPPGRRIILPVNAAPTLEQLGATLPVRLTPDGVALSLCAVEGRALAPPLQPVMLAHLKEAFAALDAGADASCTQATSSRTVTLVRGVDAFRFGEGRAAFIEHAIQQVASQFNFLEAPSPVYAPPSAYAADRTQGPRAALGCAAALLQRDARFKHAKVGRVQPLFASELLCSGYRGGYFEPTHLASAAAALRYLSAHVDELQILIQRGASVFGPTLLQVFTAAPSFQSEPRPARASVAGELASLLVVSQYKALGQLAVLLSHEIRESVPLHLTAVGQGVFNNPPEVLEEAWRAVFAITRGHDVRLFAHAFSEADAAQLTTLFAKLEATVTDLGAPAFYAGQRDALDASWDMSCATRVRQR